MKKLLSIILALTLVLAFAVPAFAADNDVDTDGNGSSDQEITAKYEELEKLNGGDVYYVTIAWDSQEGDLYYTGGTTTYTWDGSVMQYQEGDVGVGAGWYGSATIDVTVTNQSNAGITVTTDSSTTYGLDITAEEAEVSLTSAAVNEGAPIDYTDIVTKGEEQSETITFTINSNNSKIAWDNTGTVGTVTVEIEPTV